MQPLHLLVDCRKYFSAKGRVWRFLSMGKLFGTDGIRGIVGETLTAAEAFRVGQAIAVVLKEETGRRPVVTLGKDTRVSSDMLESALMAGLCDLGADVMPLGTIPTPAVAYLTVLQGADAGIVISASHNPYEHNGIKVFNSQGYKLSDELEQRVEEKILSDVPMKSCVGGEIGRRLPGTEKLHAAYIDHLASTISSDLSGLRLLVDCANGAASATAPELFARFQAQVDFIHTPARRHQHQQPLRLHPSGGSGCHLWCGAAMIWASPLTATPTAASWWMRRDRPSTATRLWPSAPPT